MKKIWKFICDPRVRDNWKTDLPTDFKVIHTEDNQMWIEGSHTKPTVTVEVLFAVVGTGHDIPHNFEHVGTWRDGPFVWHLYMLTSGAWDND